MNKMGYDSFDEVFAKGNRALSLDDFKAEIETGALILDVRTEFDFAEGFIPNSLFIGLNGTFAMWVGALIEDIDQKIVLIVPEGKEEEAVTRLSRVGYDNTVGYLKGGVASWDGTLSTVDAVTAKSIESKHDALNIIDVRKPGEWEAEHIDGASHHPLDFLNHNLDKLDKNTHYHVHCAGGYRSVITISLLMRNGFTKLTNILGGMDEILKTNIPKTDFVCPTEVKRG